MTVKTTPTFMAESRWLASLDARTRELISAHARTREFNEGEVVFRKGDQPDGLYGVLEGQVRLAVTIQTGQQVLNYVADAGDWFGGVSTLDGKPRLNDAICAGPVKLAYLSQADTQRLLQQEPGFAHAVGILVSRLHRAAMSFAIRALTQPVSAQIAYSILSLARKKGRRRAGATLAIRQEDLANMVGVSRQTIAPLLRSLQERGVITLGYGSITVLDPKALEQETQQFRS